jgi:hypothetical protein
MENIQMNEELLKWMKEKAIEIKKKPPPLRKPTGKCQICGERDAKFACLKCSRETCVSCYFKIIGVCQKCVPKELVAKWMEKHPKKILGIEWIE